MILLWLVALVVFVLDRWSKTLVLHSFVPGVALDSEIALGISDYGSEFASVVGRGNVFGTQFHPEKSSRDGIALLANFVRVAEARHVVQATAADNADLCLLQCSPDERREY